MLTEKAIIVDLPETFNTISVVTPSFNQGAFIEETIQSILSQKGNFYIDYIINDGVSNDDSLDVILKYEKLLQQNCDVVEKMGLSFFVGRNKDFRWNNCSGISYRWVSEKDEGQADAINKGFRAAKGNVLAYLNSDDLYYPDAFSKVMEVNWDKTDFIYGKGMWVSEKGEPLLLYPTFKPAKYSLFFQCTLCQPTVFMARKVFEELGEFSTLYHCIFDYEYWIRAVFKGKKFTYIKSRLAQSRMYQENKSLSCRDTVGEETAELKKKYYQNSNFNTLLLRIYERIVQRKTVNRVVRLQGLLGNACLPLEGEKTAVSGNEAILCHMEQEPGRRMARQSDSIALAYDISVLGAGEENRHSRTGVFRVVENVMLGLMERQEINLTLFCLPQFSEYCRKYLRTSAESASLGKLFSRDMRNLNRYGIDIFHFPFFPIPAELRKIRTIQQFITIYDLIPVKYPLSCNQGNLDCFQEILKSITPDTRILCISHSTKNDLCNHLGFVDPDNVFVTHLAASPLFHLVTQPESIRSAKRKYSIPESPYILGLSTLEPRKNIEMTIQAFSDLVLQEKISDLNLVLVGTKGWKFDSILEKARASRKVKERVIFTDFVEDKDLAAIYSGAMMFVYPSLYEGFGLPPLEAMQCGVPVITSNSSSLPEVVGDAGLMIDPNDRDALCQNILDLYNSSALRESMKAKSLQQAQKFSWKRCVDETVDAYEKALKQQKTVASSMACNAPINIGINFTGLIPGKIGGMEKYMRAIVHHIPRLSDSHTLFVFLRPETMNEIEETKRVKKVCIKNTDPPNCIDSEIHQRIKQLGIDIWFSPLLILDPQHLDIPAVYCVPDLQHEYYPEFFTEDVLQWRKTYFERSAKLAEGIFTISNYSKNTLVEKFNIPPDKIHVTWLDCPTYFTLDKAIQYSEYVKKAYNLPDRYVFYPANTWPHKNHLTLIKALESYHSCYGSPPDLVLTGYESDAHGEVLRAIKNSAIKDRMHFLGYIEKDHMPAIYKNASCLVFPSMYEGFGIPLVEAMRTECPIIAAKNTTMFEIAGDAAIYFNTMDEIELSVCIKYMMNTPPLRRVLIENGKKRADLFSFEKCAEKTLKVLENIYAAHAEKKRGHRLP